MTLPLRILIVEDSADDAEVALLELARGGIAPAARRVESAAEMRAALADGPWDAVLSDYTMPGFGAAEAFALCRAADPDLPFVVVSGTIGEHRAVEMMRAGAGDYLLKGNLARLAAAVEREVREAKGRRGLRGAERKARDLAAIVASSDDAIVGKTLAGTVTSWNAGAERLYGYAAGEIVGRSIAPLISPDRPDEEAGLLGRVAGGERVEHFETERVRKDGTRVDISITLSPVRDEDGRVVGVSAIARDIGDRKRQDAALRASEARLLRAQQVANVGSWETDPATLEVTWSDQTYRIFEVEPRTGSMTHGRFLDLVHPEDRTRVHQAFLESLTHGSPSEITHRILTPAGTLKSVEEHWQVEADDRGKPIRVVGTCQDVTDRTRSEEVLRYSEERYRSLVDATAAIVWDSPASGAFDSEQPGWTKFTGQTVEQHRGWGWLDAIHPDDREKSARAWEAAVATQSVYLVDHRLRNADGEYRHMTGRAIPILDGDGAIREWVGVHTDVTERQRADSDRRELLDRLNLQIERLPLAYLLTGPDLRYTRWNPAAERIFGFAEAEVLGRHPFDVVVPPQARTRVGEIFDLLKGGDMNAHGTSENITRDARTITCEWYNTPLFDAAGIFTGVLSLAQDVTERKRLEEQYHQAERRLHHVVASSPVVLFTLALAADHVHGIDWIGENLLDVLGHRPDAALSPDWWRANIHPEDRQRVVAQTDADLFGHGHATHEYRFRHGDGSYRWTRGELRLIRDAAGRPVEVVGSWSDITERKSLEEQFRQAQKMDAVGRLAGGVAHDFNNLLTVINGYGEIVHAALPADHPSRE
ncbi:MAG TPA: PAS domain S-box protein, partial [Urbifossiella sp.]|nr:PAS domain S-box protein [Urbifossiella sp.]